MDTMLCLIGRTSMKIRISGFVAAHRITVGVFEVAGMLRFCTDLIKKSHRGDMDFLRLAAS
jgi:hypothetical protein